MPEIRIDPEEDQDETYQRGSQVFEAGKDYTQESGLGAFHQLTWAIPVPATQLQLNLPAVTQLKTRFPASVYWCRLELQNKNTPQTQVVALVWVPLCCVRRLLLAGWEIPWAPQRSEAARPRKEARDDYDDAAQKKASARTRWTDHQKWF